MTVVSLDFMVANYQKNMFFIKIYYKTPNKNTGDARKKKSKPN